MLEKFASKIYGMGNGPVPQGSLLTWKLVPHPFGSKHAISLWHCGQVIGYLEDQYVGTVLEAQRNHVIVHVIAKRRPKGFHWAKVILIPRADRLTQKASPSTRLPYVDS